MSSVMLAIGSVSLYKSALVIALGAAACFALMYALYISHGGFGPAAWLFAAADIVLSVLFCRFLHYYCHAEQYASFFKAMTDYSLGGYVLVGTVPAAIQTPTSMPMSSKMRIASIEGAMPSTMPSSMSSQE